ncbi:MAG: integral rane sensor signal transduction histidine kinase [Firmicutes bacterium]|nr:integral rane sensor signal transduction histidine kinase [Bacillota bacterium]
MFKKTRRKLTLLYTGLFFCLLLVFTTIVVTASSWLFLSQLKQEVQLLAHEEMEEQKAVYRIKDAFIEDEDQNDYLTAGLFHCVVDNDGNIMLDGMPEKLRQPVLEAIHHWREPAETTILIKSGLEKDETVFFLLTAEPIVDEAKSLGIVYFGKDITSYYVLYRWILIGLAVTLVLFLFLALGIGYLLAGRAMIPVVQSFIRQREFTADASHELRTPISILLASTDVIRSDKGTTLSPLAHQVLEDMREEIRKMAKLISDLLIIARGDNDALVVQRTGFDLRLVAEQVIRTLEPLAQDKRLNLCLISPSSFCIEADEVRISQLLFILLDNAVKYTPAGGNVSLTLEKDEVRRGIRIIVADNGIGIAPEEQQKIFDRFYRSDKARSRDLGGAGLGLAIATQIVSSHNGEVSVDSKVGKGTVFTVFLPVFTNDNILINRESDR